jgi:hypothetical protein
MEEVANMRRIKLISMGMLVLTANTLWATTFYISPSGSNANSGLSTAPWKTFEFAIPKLQLGDTLILMDGIYHGNTGYPLIDCTANLSMELLKALIPSKPKAF